MLQEVYKYSLAEHSTICMIWKKKNIWRPVLSKAIPMTNFIKETLWTTETCTGSQLTTGVELTHSKLWWSFNASHWYLLKLSYFLKWLSHSVRWMLFISSRKWPHRTITSKWTQNSQCYGCKLLLERDISEDQQNIENRLCSVFRYCVIYYKCSIT